MSEEQPKEKKQIDKEFRILAKNSILSVIHIYSSFIFSLITSFIIARLISPGIWSYLILSTSYISIFSLILTFLPPSLEQTFNYYISNYRALKHYNTLKSFVKNAIILRTISVLLVFIISLFTFIFLSDLFKLSLENYYPILLIISPMLIINGLGKVLISIERTFNMFNLVLYLLILKYMLNIGGLIYITIFFESIQLSDIAFINLISEGIPFLINCIYIILFFRYKIKKSDEERISFKSSFKYLYSYGSHLSIKIIIDGLIRELRVQVIRLFETPDYITAYHNAYNYKSISGQLIQSLSEPLTITFSDLNTKKKFNEMKKIVDSLFGFLVFIILLFSGFLIYLADIYLTVVLGELYLKFSLLFKLLVISIIFNVIGIFFQSLMRGTNKVKFVTPISIMSSSITFCLYLIGLVLFGIHIAVLGTLIGSIINFFILVYLTFKLFKIKIDLKKIVFQYLIFFISLGITYLLEILILREINTLIFEILSLSYFASFQLLSLLIFLILYLSLNIVFKIFTIKDIELIEAFFIKETFFNKLIRRGTNILKFFIKKDKMIRNS